MRAILGGIAIAVAGCAGVGEGGARDASDDAGDAGDAGSSAELRRARAAVALAWASPNAPLALEELGEAGRALEFAEQEARARPGSQEARDAAYVAERKAERARLAALVEVNRQALHTARRTHAQAARTVEEARRAGQPRGAVMGPAPQ